MAVGASAMEDAAARRVFPLLAQRDKKAHRRAVRFIKADDVPRVPSVANCLACCPLRSVLFKEFKTIANKSPDCNYHGPSQPYKEQCLKKKYEVMQHDLDFSRYHPKYGCCALRIYKEFRKKSFLGLLRARGCESMHIMREFLQ